MHRDFKGESIYLAEVDVHFPELTLGQTLTFAASTREAGPQRSKISQEISKDLSILFNINNSFDTWMGNAMIRGVSGGEKRRTSIAEAFTSGAQLQFWDNSTRGLDSTTALQFIELLRLSTTNLKTTLALSIYQASEAMYSVSPALMWAAFISLVANSIGSRNSTRSLCYMKVVRYTSVRYNLRPSTSTNLASSVLYVLPLRTF